MLMYYSRKLMQLTNEVTLCLLTLFKGDNDV